MLSELVVNNFAIIDRLHVSFEPGLNILSGETGAGKSIVVGAVNLLLGSRASQEMIRTGSKEAQVEAVFLVPEGNPLLERLEAWGLEPSPEILVRRVISRTGRNRTFVNNHLVTLQQLQEMAQGLASVSGQHEHQLLLDASRHLALLDAYGSLEDRRARVSRLHLRWSAARDALQRLRRSRKERAEKSELMRFQLEELEKARLEPQEDERLQQELHLLQHAMTLKEASRKAYNLLYAERGAVLERLTEVERNLGILQDIDPSQQSLSQNLEQARIHLDELSHALNLYENSLSPDSQRLAAVEERLSFLHRLGKKYGVGVDEMIRLREELKRNLAQDEQSEEREDRLQKEQEELRAACLKEAAELSRERRRVSESLAREVAGILTSLDMERTRFGVRFDLSPEEMDRPDVSPGPWGIDNVEFLLAANPGEDLKPLARIASGGELSRILLALKSLLGLRGDAETLVFDEVDTGIGGRTAELVGLQLKRLARKSQVLCITHLPQIACYGSHHFKVFKRSRGDETLTEIAPLDDEQRVEELARMMGGLSISDKTRAHALELLQRAQGDG